MINSNKRIYSQALISCCFMLIAGAALNAQSDIIIPSVINDYKFVQVAVHNIVPSNGWESGLALNSIKQKLSDLGVPVFKDNSMVSNKCEVLFCYFGNNGSPRHKADPFRADIYFTNCHDSVILYIPYANSREGLTERRTSTEAYFKSYIDRMFRPFGSYHYTYNPPIQAATSNTIPTQVNPPVQNNTGNTSQPSAVTNDKTKITAPTQSLTSDVDINIPASVTQNEMMFAVIIGNEDYATKSSNLSPEVNVPYAVNDAKVFKEYCLKTLGIPEQQIRYFENATFGQMKSSITWLSGIAKVDNGKAKIIFYYAGHGIPDEASKSAYLMPVDGVPSDMGTGIKLADLYKTLGEANAQSATVFLDACFSGGGRNAGLLAARGVRIKPKEESITGNLVVFSASSGEETSLPYKDKSHGLFTYFLLKELQKNKGNEAYGEMAENIKNNVALQSLVVNNKLQTPQVNTGNAVADNWKNWRMK